MVNFRGVEDCTIEFDPDGITVVVGDNEVGKSTIFDALHMILNERHSAKTREVRGAKPVDRDAGPEVEVELSTGEYRFEYWKRWLKDAEATLSISGPTPENLTGREAHDRAEQILADTLDMDLWAALRMLQSGDLKMPGFAVKSLGEALDMSADGAPPGGLSDSLHDKAEKEYLEFWTRTGKEKKIWADDKAETDAARKRRDDLQRQQDDVDSDQRRLERLAGELDELRQQEREQDRTLTSLTEEWRSTEALRLEAGSLAQQEKTAEAELRNAETAQRERRRLMEDAERTKRDVKNGKADLSTAEEAVSTTSEQVNQAEEALRSANNVLGESEHLVRVAEEDAEHHALRKQLNDLKADHERAAQAQQHLIDAEKTIDACLGRDEADEIADAEGEMKAAEAKFAQFTATVTATALGSIVVEVDGEMLPLEPDDEERWQVANSWELVLPEQVRVSVQVGDDSKRLAEEHLAARKKYEDLCSRGGVAGTAEARWQATARERAEKTHEEAKDIIDACLSGTTLDVLAAKIDSTSKAIDSYEDGRTADVPLPADAEEAEEAAVEAKQQWEARTADVNDRQEDLDKARQALTDAERETRLARERLEEVETRAADAEGTLFTARLSIEDSAIDVDLAEKRQRLDDLRALAGEASLNLESKDVETLNGRLESADGSLRRTRTDIQNIEHGQKRLEGGLQQAGAQGLSTELAEAESKLEFLERQIKSTELKAQAAKRLHETLDKHRRVAHSKHSEPFKQEIERLGRFVFGGDFEVGLDENMAIISRTLNKQTLSVDQLSTGTREQLGVLCRLACASITSPDGKGTPVVIDDALGWSDTARLQSMGQAITQAGSKCQIIILTCMPGRYGNVGQAKTVRL